MAVEDRNDMRAQNTQQAFQRAASVQRPPNVSESIKKTRPALDHNMPGPFGTEVRSASFNAQWQSDRQAAAANFRDKPSTEMLLSKDMTPKVNSLTKEFEKSHGRQLGVAFNNAKGSDRGR